MYDRETLVLREPITQFGMFEDLDLVAPGEDPEDYFVPASNPLAGYVRMGTVTLDFADTFVEYKSGTPHQTVRMDMLERQFTAGFEANQYEMETYRRYFNMLVEEGAPWNHFWFGYDTPTRPYYGILYKSTKVDGSAYNVGQFYSQSVPTALSLASKGTDYAGVPTMFRSFVHPDFEADPGDYSLAQKAYGIVYEPGTGSSS